MMLDNSEFKSRLNLINKRLAYIEKARNKSVRFLFKNIKLMSGKRVRGLLVLLTCEAACGKIRSGAINTAAAIELLHHATLIHDDIVDNSGKRRGDETLNKKLGYEFSVLTGDYLLSRANSLIFGENDLELLRIITESVIELCEGEIEEVYNKGNSSLGEHQYLEIIRKKTASLIRASVDAGLVAGGAKGRNRDLAEFGVYLGMAFQIKDDILDMTSSYKKLGKTAGSDIKEGKATLPYILALRNTSNGKKQALKALFEGKNAKKLIEKIKEAGGIRDAEEKALAYVYRAKSALRKAKLKYPVKKELIEKLAEYVIERNY